ncbi:MAG: hypothetical protein GY953_21795, partial [bacterium]|nr:hypothetical protein [bacterium]
MSQPRSRKGGGFSWRKWNIILHRDIGYLAVGLTFAYAVSGIAVNHNQDWNANYRFQREEVAFEPFEPTSRDEVVQRLRDILDLPPPKGSHRRTSHQIELFYDGWSVEADVTAGTAMMERPRERPIVRDANFLHLNEPRGWWTLVADLYAVILIFLAVSGSLIARRKKGITGRGKWLIGI